MRSYHSTITLVPLDRIQWQDTVAEPANRQGDCTAVARAWQKDDCVYANQRAAIKRWRLLGRNGWQNEPSRSLAERTQFFPTRATSVARVVDFYLRECDIQVCLTKIV
jgi:hypothetical protein